MEGIGGLELVDVGASGDEALLARFYRGPYWEAFHHQREPLAVWRRLLWGGEPSPLEQTVLVAVDRGAGAEGDVAGGVVFEYYPASACGLVTYVVVAPAHRRRGLGRALIDRAAEALGARAARAGRELVAVLAEVSDPRTKPPGPERAAARARIERFQRWGARVVDLEYVQPDLGAGLGRDRRLRLIAFAPAPPVATLDGAALAAFFHEFFVATEGALREGDEELAELLAGCDGEVPLVALNGETRAGETR